jgi:hypothetical protein
MIGAQLNKRRREGEGGRLAHQASIEAALLLVALLAVAVVGYVLRRRRRVVHPRSLLLLLPLFFSAVAGEALANRALCCYYCFYLGSLVSSTLCGTEQWIEGLS